MSIDNDTILPAVVAPTLASIREGNAYLAVSDTGIAVLTCRELLNGKGYTCNATSSTYDAALRDIVKEFQSDFGLTSDGYLGQGTLAVLEDTQSDTGWFVNGVANITAGKLARLGFKKLVLKPANVKKQNEICNSYGINSKTKIRHFLAQGMLETMCGTTFTETIYRPGDSTQYESYAPYCGAGFLQLTHNYNYEAFREYMKTEKGILIEIDKWARRRIRAVYWKQWKRVRTRYRILRKLKLEHWQAIKLANSRCGYWRMAEILGTVITNKIIVYEN